MKKPSVSAKGKKQKGDNFERELAHMITDFAKIEAHRMPLSGAVKGYEGDVKILHPRQDILLQAKFFKDGFKTIYGWMEDRQPLYIFDTKMSCGYLVLEFWQFAQWLHGREFFHADNNSIKKQNSKQMKIVQDFMVGHHVGGVKANGRRPLFIIPGDNMQMNGATV